jgi:predicted DNA-binding protein (UPF0278 family)
MTEWKRNRILKAKKITAAKANKASSKASYIGNIFNKIRNKIAKIIKKLRNSL